MISMNDQTFMYSVPSDDNMRGTSKYSATRIEILMIVLCPIRATSQICIAGHVQIFELSTEVSVYHQSGIVHRAVAEYTKTSAEQPNNS